MYKSVKKTVDENNNFNGYKILTLNDEITFVPNKVNNKDYQDILEWEKIEGNTIEEADWWLVKHKKIVKPYKG